MTETQELAEDLVVKFVEWNGTLPLPAQGLSMVKITQWAYEQLSGYNSYNVIDQVIDIMVKRLMPSRIRSDGKLAHIWLSGKDLGFKPESKLYTQMVCFDCGNLKGPPQYPETACKGLIKITLR